MKKRLVVGNWKMYIESSQEAKKFASALRRRSRQFSGVEVVLAPAYPLIPVVTAALKGSQIKVAAQTLSGLEGLQHTGEVSAHMLKTAGASLVIVGHSERRALGETNEIVALQVACAVKAGLTALLCVGEREREQHGGHFSLIEQQLTSALASVKNYPGKIKVAYEPVWAIGKSATDAMKPSELREMAIFIRKTLAQTLEHKAALRVPILYGGAVEAENAGALIAEGDVSGLLVGHASASLDSFIGILEAVKR